MLRLLILLLLLSAPAAAQEREAADEQFGATAEVEAPPPSTNRLDATASGTEVLAHERAATGESVQELLFDVPGTHVVQTGGPGAFSGVALRGGELSQTAVLLGDVPLSGPDTGGLDLSLLPLGAFERLEVYRGGAPTWLNSGAIGGALRLVPRAGLDRIGASATYGSFGTWRVGAFSALSSNKAQWVSAVGANGSQGDFPYDFDNATAFDRSDDRTLRRQNAETLGAHAFAHARLQLSPRDELSAVILGVSRQGGAPGPGAAYALRTHRTNTRVFGTLAYQHQREGLRLQLSAGGGHQRHRFTDRDGELGLSAQATDDRIDAATLRAAAEIRAANMLDVTLVAAGRWDGFRPEDALSREAGDSARWTASAAVEARLHGELAGMPLELRPSVRVEHSRTEAHEMLSGMEQLHQTQITAPTYRLAAAWSPTRFMTWSASISRGTRLPSVLELFGNRGALQPSPGLQPETGRMLDAGVVVRHRGEGGQVVGELRFFHNDVDQLIRYRPTAQHTAKAENVEGGRVLGIEAGTRATLGRHLACIGALTWMDSAGPHGAALSWRPALQTQLRPELMTGRLGSVVKNITVFASWNHRSSFFQDPANLIELPGRHWIGAGARLDFARGVSFLFTARDLLDQRGQDFLGFPLPGRRFAATLRYQKEL